jgi:hypothetical protein
MANNLRIVTDNAADRATIAASTTAGSLTTANLKTDIKSEVWRATGTSATLTLTWTNAETVGCVVCAFANFTSLATMRARGYANVADVVGTATTLFDTAAIQCCPPTPLGLWDWGNVPLGVNAYAFGGFVYGVVWPTAANIRKLVIDIADSTNSNGYVEVGRIVCGPYWSPAINAEYGAQAVPIDSSTHQRTDAGDLFTNRGFRSKALSFDMGSMTAADRIRVWDIFVTNGKTRPLFLSLSPQNNDDPTLEQQNQVYGKLNDTSAVAFKTLGVFATKIDIEEV